MNVRYIGDYYKVSLQKGKIYTVNEEIDGMYCIVDESGDEYAFSKDEFEIVD